ncbi:MAG: hypothetical protein R3338_13100, partial [Thermoanaerobaculia bacterium]|nr:hypothetical protein [Thermoanaerobaculia bacterium]
MRRFTVAFLGLLLATTLFATEAPEQKRVIRIGAETIASKAEPAAEGPLLRLHSVTFDPLAAVTDYSAVGLRNLPSNEYGIVQLDANRHRAKEQLERAGIEILGYLPDRAYRVRMNDSARKAIDSIEGIRWAGPYLPGYKVHSSLWKGSGDPASEILFTLFPSEDPRRISK